MYRSPFGILDHPLTSTTKNETQQKRPLSANATKRSASRERSDGKHSVSSFTEMARENYKDTIRDTPIVDTGTGRARPRSAGAIRVTSSKRVSHPTANDEYDSIDMLTGSLSKTQLVPKSSEEPAMEENEMQQIIINNGEKGQIVAKKKKKTKRSQPSAEKKSTKQVINNVELTQEEWERIFAKYNLPGIDEEKFNFLRKGTGFTTKYDYVGKKQAETLSRPTSATPLRTGTAQNLSSSVGSRAVKSEQELDAMMQEFFPSSSSRGVKHQNVNQLDQYSSSISRPNAAQIPVNEGLKSHGSHVDNHSYLREYSKKKKQEDQEFSQLLEKELMVETQHLQRCIQECNEFCEYLGKECTYQYRDYRSVRKVFANIQYQQPPDQQPLQQQQQNAKHHSSQSIRIITVDKFHAEHASLLKEFKTFSKYHPKHSLDTAKPPDSAHFIGVDDLFQQAKKLEGESESKKSVNNNTSKQELSNNTMKTNDDDPYHPTVVHYNELKRRNETIAMQLQIMQEYDDLNHLLTSQLNEIQRKGWNLHYKTLFLSNFSS